MRFGKDAPCNLILDAILSDPLYRAKDYTFIILGDGPCTGKTWLYNELRMYGFNVIEISEEIAGLVMYRDKQNHCMVDDLGRQVVIVLNQPIRNRK